MSFPKNIRCRNFNDEGVGVCDSGEYCRFVHPGPRWPNARSYHNRDEFDHIPRSYIGGGGGARGAGRGRPVGGGGGGKGPIPRRCRNYEPDGSPIRGGCFRHPKGECRFTHPDQPGWDTATPSENSFSKARNSFGLTSGSNSFPTGPGRGGSTPTFGGTGMDTTADTTSGPGFRFGTSETLHSPEASTPSLGWGQGGSNEPGQPANETSGGGGWGGENASHGWGAGEAANADSGWGAGETTNTGGGWETGETINTNGGWGAGETTNTNNGWGVGETTNTDSGCGAGETANTNSGWGGGDGGSGEWGSAGGWGSSGNVSGSGGGGGWGLSSKNDAAADRARPTTQKEAVNTNPPVATSLDDAWGSSSAARGPSTNTMDSSDNAWGSSNNAWGSSGWGSSNNTWTTSNETTRDEPASYASPDKGKGRERETNGQSGGWSGWRDTSNSDTTAGLHSSGGGWGSSAPSVPATIDVAQDYTHATTRLDTAPAAMDVDEGEPHFEGKAILNALESVVHRRRNKRKRSHDDIRLSPRYYRHLLAPQRTAGSRVDGDGDAVMSGTKNQPICEEPLEAGEIVEVPPSSNYDMTVLSREPETSEEKTTFAKHLLYIFTEAAVTVDRSRKAEKRYEDYKKSQEARIYNHPGRDARAVLMEKLRSLRTTSHDESERLTRIVADLGSLPSHHLSDVVAYNEHNHLTEEALTVEKRKAAIDEAENSLSTKHDRVDRSLIALQARLEDMAKEKQAREIIRDLPPPVDPNETAVEEAVIVHQANVQRVTVVEASLETITSAELIPHRDGPIRTLEKSLPTMDSQAAQLQGFAEGIAKLIQQVPVVRGEINVIKAGNEERKEAEKTHEQGVRILDEHLVTSSAQLEALNAGVKRLVEGLRLQVTTENVKSAIQPALQEQTRVVMEDVREYCERGLDVMRGRIREERAQMEAHIYSRLVGTQRLFEAVGCYLRSVRADLASLVDKDRGTTEPS